MAKREFMASYGPIHAAITGCLSALDPRHQIVELAERLAAHQGVTHFAISMRIFGKGDFFKGLKGGRDCRTRTAVRALGWFTKNWPADLDWPSDIPRPQAPDASTQDAA